MIGELTPYLRGWAGYFGFSQGRELESLDGWVRRRLRCVVWVQWKTQPNRFRELARRGIPKDKIAGAVYSPKGPWRVSTSYALNRAFSKARFRRLGLPAMAMLAEA